MAAFFLFLLLTRLPKIVLTDDYPDYYGVRRNGEDDGYKIFKKVGDCRVYITGDHRVLFQEEGKWKIATHFGYYAQDCQNILTKTKPLYDLHGVLKPKGTSHFTIKTQSFTRTTSIDIRSLPRCKQIKGLKLSQGTVSNAQNRIACTKVLKNSFPNRNIISSFSYSQSSRKWQCKYEDDDLAILEEEIYSTLYVHSSCAQQTEHLDLTEQKNSRNPPKAASSTTTTKPEPSISISTTTASSTSEAENVAGNSGELSTMVNISIAAGIMIVLLLGMLVGFYMKRKKERKEVIEENEIYGMHDPGQYYEDENNAEVRDENDYYSQI